MDLLETTLVVGVISGMLYALSGAGLVLIFRTSGYISFAQGDIAAIGLFTAYYLGYQQGLPYPLVALIVIVVCAAVGGLFGLLIVPMEKFGVLAAALATIGLGIAIQGGENATVGSDPRAFPSLGQDAVLSLGKVSLTGSDVGAFVVCLLIFAALGVAFKLLRAGVAMRAVNDNREAAEILGVPARRLKVASWVLSGVLAGTAGLFVVPLYALSPSSVNVLLFYGFVAIVVGGFDSITGALVGGLLIGVAANLTAAYVSPNLLTTAVYITLLCVLILRPQGLLGRRMIERV
jgi:branched-chain amino acid transport system permease protein